MDKNNIAINGVIYEVERIYGSKRTVSELVVERIAEAKSLILPLTSQAVSMYNNNCGDDMREDRI